MRYDWRETSLVTLHNFSGTKQTVRVKIDCPRDELLVEVFDGHHSKTHNDGAHRIRTGRLRLALVPCRRARQRTQSIRSGSDQPKTVITRHRAR